MVFGPLISAGASILGGLFGKSSADKAQEMQAQHNAQQIALQKEFAQSGIQWKVADAKKAGIHPLYALGANTASYAPVSSNFSADTSMASAMSSAGQDIGRAINATRNTGDRADAFTTAVQKLAVEKGGLENEILKLDLASKTARLRQQTNPPMPVGQRFLAGLEGQSAAPDIKIEEKNERVSSDPSNPSKEAFAVPDVGHSRTAGGGYSAIPSKDVKERIEDNLVQEVLWAFRNNVLPSFGFNQSPPPHGTLPKGYDKWIYQPFKQEYTPHRKVPYLPLYY